MLLSFFLYYLPIKKNLRETTRDDGSILIQNFVSLTINSKEIQEISTYFKQVMTEEDMREYTLLSFASFQDGHCRHQIFRVLTGSGGNVTGCFLVTGSGASSTQGNTSGTLYSAGAFSVAKAVTAGDTVSVTYSTTATS
mgnify:CR=1 FL=1